MRVADFFAGAVEHEKQARQAVARLQDHLLKPLSEGVEVVIEWTKRTGAWIDPELEP